jgi:hypothetical protein
MAMNKLTLSLLLAGVAAMAAGPATAGVKVSFLQGDQYQDMPLASWQREDVLKDLEAHFSKLAKALPEGTDLKIEVLDLDLAGRLKPMFRGHDDIRILTGGADWPHMKLRYTLERDGKVVASGEDQLSNMAYLQRANRYFSGDPLRYEKQMMDDWFKEKIASR